MYTRNRWRYVMALCAIRRIDEQLYTSYLQPRLFTRAAMWTNLKSPSVPTFGRRDNNFVEATHRSLKRHGINAKIRLWQSVERITVAFEQIFNDRQVKMFTARRGIHTIVDRPEMDALCSRLVPKAVSLLDRQVGVYGQGIFHLSESLMVVTENGRSYTIGDEDWTCHCTFAVDFQLPCRHALLAYMQVNGVLGMFYI